MAINIEVYLKNKANEIEIETALKLENLYSDIDNLYLKKIFATMHQEFNRLIGYMYYKKRTNNHFNANESRKLDNYITFFEDTEYQLKSTKYAYEMNKQYADFLNECKKFIKLSGGSEIPEDLTQIRLIDCEPIFFLTQTINVKRINEEKRYALKFIGEGSYAKVFRYYDDFYNTYIIIKRAKKGLTPKEIERFEKEYETMKKLNSPYILKVYRYDKKELGYYAEYCDETLFDYIKKNNTKITMEKRKRISYQIFMAFKYIHEKELLHRDISLTNVLIKHYDDTSIIKISDFGQVKEKNSNLTTVNSEVRGSLNDDYLSIIGFKNYSIEYETYALTKLILFVLTGKINIEKVSSSKIKEFVFKGTSRDIHARYQNIDEMIVAFNKIFEK